MMFNLPAQVGAKRESWIVGALALAIYLPAIWWGLPHATHALGVHSWEIDAVTGLQTLSELHNLFVAPKPDWYVAYPPFHYLLLGIVYAPYFAFLYLTGGFSQPATGYPFGLSDPVAVLRNLTLIGRAVTLLMASGIIVSVYLTAQTVWDRQTARLAALAAALPTTMVFYARTGNLDIPVLFWTSLAVLLIARCLSLGFTVRRAVWLGTCAALAVATKDQAYGALIGALVMFVIIHFRRGTPNTQAIPYWKAPLALGLAGLTVYALASGLLISPHRFFEHISFVKNFDQTFFLVIHLNNLRPPTLAGYAALVLDFLKELLTAVGPVLLAAGFIGLVATWRTSVFSRILLAMMFGYVALVIFPIRFLQYRYVMIPAFILSFLIARAFVLGLRQKRGWAATTMAAMILGFGWIGLRAIDLTYQMIFDARYEARRWLEQNAKPGDRIAFFSVQNILPRIPAETTAVQLTDESAPLEKLRRERIRFVLVQADWSSQIGSDRSHFFPESVYTGINDGSLGYEKAASFETAGLFRGFLLDLPLVTPGYIVNTPLKIYELKQNETAF